MGRFEAAFDDLNQASAISTNDPYELIHIPFIGFGELRKTTYQEVAILWKFGHPPKNIGAFKFILALLILNEGKPLYMTEKDGKPHEFSRGIHIQNELPYLVPILKEIIGEETWQAANQGQAYEAKIKIKKSTEQ
jgi:hypothetical protein